ncbi:MAG TPA: methionine synthase [Verrucomicrobiae bacterium]|nr:methionine synthase [Verrucomicrobiae bacterium]
MSLPYRADHIGSFLRPPEIIEARRPDSPNHNCLREIEDRAISRVLAKQKDLGFDIFTDGEFRRSNFMGDFTEAIEGVDYSEGLARTWKAQQADQRPPDQRMGPVRGIVVERLRQVKPLTGHELPYLKQHSPGAIKMTLPSATQFPAIMFKWGATDKVYKDHSALLWHIVEIVRKEMATLAAEGVKYIQIDAPRYSYYMDPKWREWIRTNMKVEPDTALDDAINADNACFAAARRPGIVLAIHLCRGNSRSHWYAEGGYDPIAEKMFSTMDVDRFLLEYEDARSGTFAPLRFVPKNKIVVLGLISSKVAKLEDGDAIVRRIHEAAKYVPLENLALSPQCGFASTLEGNLLTEEDQWAKMRLVVETVRRVWG